METQAVAVLGLQPFGGHIGRNRLDGIEHVHAQLDQVGDERPDGAAGVVQHPPAQPVNVAGHLPEIRRDKLAKHRQRNQRPALAAQVADQQVKVDPSAGRLGGPSIVLQVEVGELAAEEMHALGIRRHIEEHPFPAAHQGRALPDIGEAIDQGELLVLTQPVA